MRAILKFSVCETADILEISSATVKTRLHRARKISREHIEGRCSLINPHAPCDCRGYAAYLQKHNKTDKLLNIRVVHNKEKEAVRIFREELSVVDRITGLYSSRIVPPDYTLFKDKIKELCDASGLRILETE